AGPCPRGRATTYFAAWPTPDRGNSGPPSCKAPPPGPCYLDSQRERGIVRGYAQVKMSSASRGPAPDPSSPIHGGLSGVALTLKRPKGVTARGDRIRQHRTRRAQ